YFEQLKLLNEKGKDLTIRSPIDGEVTTWQVRDLLQFRPVQLGQALMTVVEPKGDWEVEMQMPEGNMGFVNDARAKLGTDELPVKYITATNPGVTRVGKIKEIHRISEVHGEEGNTVLIRVAINK